MKTDTVRRSARRNTYDSNGRDYLADKIGCSRAELERWITSPTVKPHLVLWRHLCITSPRRFNDAIEWINTGDNGYFYNPENLEEDLLFMCLEKGESGVAELGGDAGDGIVSYGDKNAGTKKWITQELWARTAWRIVHDNKSEGQTFCTAVEVHPATCYAFVIDLLCLAFHSIACRGAASIYQQLIMGEQGVSELAFNAVKFGVADEEDCMSTTSSSNITDHSSDGDFDEEGEGSDVGTEPSTVEASSPTKRKCSDGA